jgi:hypothetical protein
MSKTDKTELKFDATNLDAARDIINAAADASLDLVIIDPVVVNNHPFPLSIINDSYRVLKDGGVLKVGVLDKKQYAPGVGATVTNHFDENGIKNLFLIDSPFEKASYTVKGKWLVIEATKTPGVESTIADDLVLSDENENSLLANKNGNINNLSGPTGAQTALVTPNGNAPHPASKEAKALRAAQKAAAEKAAADAAAAEAAAKAAAEAAE